MHNYIEAVTQSAIAKVVVAHTNKIELQIVEFGISAEMHFLALLPLHLQTCCDDTCLRIIIVCVRVGMSAAFTSENIQSYIYKIYSLWPTSHDYPYHMHQCWNELLALKQFRGFLYMCGILHNLWLAVCCHLC